MFIRIPTAILLALWATLSLGEIIDGRVVPVADGDTITVLDNSKQQHKVRLGGIDAPESGQPFGAASKRSLSNLVYGKAVQVEGSKVDRYGRLIGKVWVQPSVCPTCGFTLDANMAQLTVRQPAALKALSVGMKLTRRGSGRLKSGGQSSTGLLQGQGNGLD